ncbi:PIG-L deacetylase family protein [Dermacoccaceae bacterium W4C1]
MPENLTALPDENWSRVLCVVAHPDDMEYGASAAVAAWTARGIEVAYLLLTGGEGGMEAAPEVIGPLRAQEQQHACETVGVEQLTILEHPDGMLEHSLALRKDISRQIRTFRPDAVLTANFDVEAYGGLNQADHRAAGLAAVDAVRDADNTWIFRELAEEEGLTKWHTRYILVAGSEHPTHVLGVDSQAVDAGVASLRCHEKYLEHVPDHPDPGVFIPEILREGGAFTDAEFGVTMRVFDLGERVNDA